MDNRTNEAHNLISQARESLKHGNLESAHDLAEKAARLAPKMVDVWLVLSASSANPRDSLMYAQKALEINPESVRAQKGLEWAKRRIRESSNSFDSTISAPLLSKPKPEPVSPNRRGRLYPILLIVLGCFVFLFAAWSAVSNPALASITSNANVPTPTQEQVWASVNIAKPQVDSVALENPVTPTAQEPFTPLPSETSLPALIEIIATATPSPSFDITDTPLPESTATPLSESVETLLPQPTETPGAMAMDIIPDTPTSAYVPPTNAPSAPQVQYAKSGNGAHWIDVNLSQQRVYAYEGDVVVNSFVVSTGTWLYPTVTGKYHIYIKQLTDNMSGPGYYLKDVPYTMYFYKGYALHGTYWHNNFGTPMSHGCVNLRTPDAQWLYYWASMGTLVNVHY